MVEILQGWSFEDKRNQLQFQTVNRGQICIHLRPWDNRFVFCFINTLALWNVSYLGLIAVAVCSCQYLWKIHLVIMIFKRFTWRATLTDRIVLQVQWHFLVLLLQIHCLIFLNQKTFFWELKSAKDLIVRTFYFSCYSLSSSLSFLHPHPLFPSFPPLFPPPRRSLSFTMIKVGTVMASTFRMLEWLNDLTQKKYCEQWLAHGKHLKMCWKVLGNTWYPVLVPEDLLRIWIFDFQSL